MSNLRKFKHVLKTPLLVNYKFIKDYSMYQYKGNNILDSELKDKNVYDLSFYPQILINDNIFYVF